MLHIITFTQHWQPSNNQTWTQRSLQQLRDSSPSQLFISLINLLAPADGVKQL